MAETQAAFDDADAYERFMWQWSRAVGERKTLPPEAKGSIRYEVRAVAFKARNP